MRIEKRRRDKWLNQLAAQDFARDRKQAWDRLPEGLIPWETFKRLANQFGLSEATQKALKGSA